LLRQSAVFGSSSRETSSAARDRKKSRRALIWKQDGHYWPSGKSARPTAKFSVLSRVRLITNGTDVPAVRSFVKLPRKTIDTDSDKRTMRFPTEPQD
jgi:hypothetical protein